MSTKTVPVPDSGRAGRIRADRAHSDNRRAPSVSVPARSRTSSHAGHDTVRAHRKRRAVLGPRNQRCRRSGVVRVPAPPVAGFAAALPSRLLRDRDRGWIDGLRALLFPGRCRSGTPWGAPFFIVPARGLGLLFQLSIGPLSTRLPIGVDVWAKLAAGRDLLFGEGGLLGA